MSNCRVTKELNDYYNKQESNELTPYEFGTLLSEHTDKVIKENDNVLIESIGPDNDLFDIELIRECILNKEHEKLGEYINNIVYSYCEDFAEINID